ncbi:probable leucine-rich repeat receptor-like protein kinase At1g68400 [Gastrolobium bilobum]|uniref:probable leucine-rich repeat receptor-like protein kinase At1g68400 n=1 Tax=Gastrolobium bilobum TaxID=150636 RepID=UPI002AAF2546|nr:probable leucine-rich repeat receptor-like protein kinase At1g68400 [Gastrolobium bilobum]
MSLVFNISFCYVILLLLSWNMVLCGEIFDFNPEERDALLLIRDSLNSSANLHGNWTGPPCLDNQSRWFGITCSNWHVVLIVLQGINLSGSLPPTFLQNITFLSQLDLRNNSLFGPLPNLTNLVFLEQVLFSFNHFSGSIPVEYVELPSLQVLELQENYLDGQIPPFDQPSLASFNVSYNHLVGPIPETSVLQRFPESSFDNNSDLCGKPLDKLCPAEPPAPSPAPIIIPPCPAVEKNKNKLQVWIIALISAAAALFLFLIIIAFLFFKRRASGKEARRNDSAGYVFRAWANKMVYYRSSEDSERLGQLEFSNKKFPVFDLDDLLRASAEVLGRGNLGITYKATLETGTVVAAKRFSYMNELSKKEFFQQMQLLGQMKHENLVEIISFYFSEEQKLIIYELISGGSLFELLHEDRGVGRKPLDWTTRLAIIKDIAKGLAFLHHSLSSHKVPHANLKSSNVLIHQDNQGYHSKLTDYGFFPLLQAKNEAEKLAIRKSPEFDKGKKLTHKADAYCFGIVMLEIITGKVPGQILGEIEETTNDLSDWVRTVVNNDWSTDILDLEILAEKEGHDAMLELTELALECTDMTPEKRPKMSVVLRRIEEIEQMKTEND